MDTMWDLVQALKNCDGETGHAEDSLSDVEMYAHDASEAAEAATERVHDIQSVLVDAIELAEKLQQQEGSDVDPIEAKVFLTDMLVMIDDSIEALTRGRARVFDRAKDWKIELKGE